MKYQTHEFNLPVLTDLSSKQMEVHLGLYAGYVKHVNLIREKIAELSQNQKENSYIINELRRRFAFEFNGMRLHEYYFEQFQDSASVQKMDCALSKAATEKYGSYENLNAHIRSVASARGIGWVVVYFDTVVKTIHTVFVSEHELGQLAGLPVILVVDMWEHAFMVDYVPAEKSKYVDAVFANLNWEVIEKRFDAIK